MLVRCKRLRGGGCVARGSVCLEAAADVPVQLRGLLVEPTILTWPSVLPSPSTLLNREVVADGKATQVYGVSVVEGPSSALNPPES